MISMNKNKYYLPNMIRHNEFVLNDQVPYLDYKQMLKEYKPRTVKVRKKRKLN